MKVDISLVTLYYCLMISFLSMLQSMPAAASTERNLFPEADNLTAFAPNICFICLKRQLKRRAKQLLMNILAIAIH